MAFRNRKTLALSLLLLLLQHQLLFGSTKTRRHPENSVVPVLVATGRRKAAKEAEYKKRKMDALEEMRDIQKDRQAHFAQLVANDGRAKAFQMAAMGYKTFKDDPAEAQKYKDVMNRILEGTTAANDDPDLPPLPGGGTGPESTSGTAV